MSLLDGQNNISKAFPMPVDDMSTSTSVVSVSGETVSLYYSNSGTRTVDAGQAAGTAVSGTFANKMILDADGAYVGNWNNKSLSFTGDCFTSEVPFDYARAERYKENTWANKLAGITSGFSNGQYTIDYQHGAIYGVKATTTASLTSAAYSINQAQTGGSTLLPSAVNLEKINNVDIPLDDAAFTPATSPVIPVGYFADETSTDSVNEGDIGAPRMTLNRRPIDASHLLDDSAFGVATDYVSAVGYFADETAADSVTEGDIGAPRMTLDRRPLHAGLTTDDAAPETGTRVTMIGGLFDDTATDAVDEGDAGYARISGDRKLIGAGAYVDDTAFTPAGANSYISLIGAEADETTPDSVDEGDAGALRMTLDRRLITASNILDDAAFGIGTSYVSPVGFLADEAATDSVDEGDVGLARMTLTRKIITAADYLEDTAHTDGDYGTQILAVRKDTMAAIASNDGDYSPLQVNANGQLRVDAAVTLNDYVDDSGFTVATDSVLGIGFLADDTATDSVDEGDIGIARMSLDRKIITAGAYVDDTAFTPGGANSYVIMMGAEVDEAATDVVDEGDAGALRMTNDRRLITALSVLDDAVFPVGTAYVAPIAGLANEAATDSVDEGDAGFLRMTLNRRLITAGHLLDDSAFGVGTDYISPVGFLVDETAFDVADEGDVGIARMTADRRILMASLTSDDAAVDPGTRVNMIGGVFDDAATDVVDEGDAGFLRITGDRKILGAGAYVDDTAFTPGGANSYVVLSGAEADETSTDSVDEGDVGALRMTLDRRLITAGQILDDAVFGIGTSYVSPTGFLVDDTGTDSVDEGDVGLARMSATRIMYVEGQLAHDTADTATNNPLKIGAYASSATSLPTAVAAGDVVNLAASTQGELFVYQTRLLTGEDQSNSVFAVNSKPLSVSTYCTNVDQSAALEASSVTKNATGVLYGLEGRLDSTAASGTYYIQFINAASLPADGAVTMLRTPHKIIHTTGTDSVFSFSFKDEGGIYASTGIVLCLSSTEFTKTIGGAFLSMTAYYA